MLANGAMGLLSLDDESITSITSITSIKLKMERNNEEIQFLMTVDFEKFCIYIKCNFLKMIRSIRCLSFKMKSMLNWSLNVDVVWKYLFLHPSGICEEAAITNNY